MKSAILILFLTGFLNDPVVVIKNTFMQNKDLSPGFHKMELKLPEGKILRYGIWIPEIKRQNTVPLILALHYGGEVVSWYGMSFMEILVEPAFREMGGIIIAPDCPGEGWTDPVSEQAVLDLLAHSIQSWPVDTNRIVITGFSMGGTGAWFLAARHPDKFSAAIPVAGRLTENIEIAIPVYAIHGGRDELIDVKPVKQLIKSLRKNGANAKLVIVPDLSHYQTPAYVDPLKETIHWLEKVWKIQAKERENRNSH